MSYDYSSAFLHFVLLCQREQWPSIIMSTSVCVCVMCVCVSVCLSTSISPELHARSLPNFLHVAYRRGSVFVRRVKWQLWRFGLVFFSIGKTLYIIAVWTHTKTAELIEMPFGLMTRVGPRYHVLDGDPIPQEEGEIFFWGGKHSGPL